MLVSCQPTFTFHLLLPYCSSSTLSTTCPLKTTFKRVSTPWIKPVSTYVVVVYSSGAGASLETEYDAWEDPDDGSNSDYESEKEESTSFVVRTQYEDDYIKEVEQLLTPDERAILEQNDAPVFSKISTTKWGLLQTLALSAQIPFMDKLLVQGLPIDAPDKDGLTALHKAVIGKREPVISHLLRKGANPHVRDKDGATPLHYAVQVGAMQTVKLLIKYKVDVNAEDNEGWTPLHVAIQSRCRDIAKVLLVNGADKTRRTKDGTSVLDLALCYGKDFKSYELTKLVKLVPAGIDP